MNSTPIDKGIFEMMLRQAVKDNFFEELDSLPSNDKLAQQYSFSTEFDYKMQKLFSKERHKEIVATILGWTKRAVAVITIIVALSFATLLTSTEVRAAVIDTVVQWFEGFTKFTSQSTQEEQDRIWTPSYLPDGFMEESTNLLPGMFTTDYRNAENHRITLTVTQSDNSISVNNENVDYSILTSDKMTYHIFQSKLSDKYSTIIWFSDGYSLALDAMLPTQELLKIAKSIK